MASQKKVMMPVQETDKKQIPAESVIVTSARPHSEETTQPDDHSRTSTGVNGDYREGGHIQQSLAAESDLERNLVGAFLDTGVSKLPVPSEKTSDDQSSQDTPSDQPSQDSSSDQPSQDSSSDQSSPSQDSSSDQPSQDSSSASSSQEEKKQSSKYWSHFEEHEWIGKGHYGQVYKAKCKVDNKFYAIKEIEIDNNLERVEREAKLLAEFEHPCIVKYHSSWAEDTVSTCEDGKSKQSSSGDSNIPFRETDSDQNCSAEGVWGSNVAVRDVSNSSCKPPSENPTAQSDLDESIPELQQICRTFYITMELCDKTLYELIDEKNGIDERKAYFRQIVEAVIHIHSKGIVHRDLKLANILIKEENGKYLVKVGDFGISASTEKKDKFCDIKQLCIIFFTLFPQYGTGMEIQKALNDKTIPKDIEQNGPELAKLVFMMGIGDRSSLTDLLEVIDKHETEELRGGKAIPESQ